MIIRISNNKLRDIIIDRLAQGVTLCEEDAEDVADEIIEATLDYQEVDEVEE